MDNLHPRIGTGLLARLSVHQLPRLHSSPHGAIATENKGVQITGPSCIIYLQAHLYP